MGVVARKLAGFQRLLRMRINDPKTGQSFFQKRRHRYEHDRGPRELTFSCYRKFPFLKSDRTRQWFHEALEEQRKTWSMDLWAYVIMPDHVHLIVSPRKRGQDVALFQGAVKERVGRQAVQWLVKHAPQWIPKITVQEGSLTRRRFWQPGGGYDRNIIQVESLLEMIRYVHANPVRRDLVARDVEWEHSSARWYAGARPVPIEMDATLPMEYR
jgi:putative transposase